MKTEMLEFNCLKYSCCTHAREKLLDSKLVLVEATGDPYWGSGLNVVQTLECLSDYWPGKNMLGEILMEVCDEVQKSDDLRKRKAASPLENPSKSSKV